MDVQRALRERLATQRLSSPPLATAADAVRLLTCVQSQERDHALFSLGLRSRSDTYDAVRGELDRGAFVRTHILRPTWHFVAAEDLRWILGLTSPRVLAGMAGRHRQLGLDDPGRLGKGLDLLTELLGGRRFLTRPELNTEFTARRSPIRPGEQLGHLLLVAELRGLVCSGPTKGVHHAYALVDEVVGASVTPPRDEAMVELVRRFFTGHGPASVRDFTRWSSLTAKDTRAALAELGDRLEQVEIDAVPHWFAPDARARRRAGAPRAYLFPTYDEAVLTYPQVTFRALPDHPYAAHTDPFWAWVVLDETNVGLWKRTVRGNAVTVDARLAPQVDDEGRHHVGLAAQRLADFLGRQLVYEESEGTPALWGGEQGHPARRPRRSDRSSQQQAISAGPPDASRRHAGSSPGGQGAPAAGPPRDGSSPAPGVPR